MVISATPMEPSPPMQKMEILQKQKSPEISKVDNVVIDELLKGGGIKKVSD